MRKIIQCVPDDEDIEKINSTIEDIKTAGFDGVFLQWYDNDLEKIIHKIKICKKSNLDIEFIHLDYKNINNLWLNNNQTNELIDYYIDKILKCKELGINMVVMHLTAKPIAPEESLNAVKNLQKLVNAAEQINVKLAFENTKISGRLDYVLNHINSNNLGICVDSGHYHAFFKDNINWSQLKNKIFTVHLHDNNGLIDQHLLPFDGNLNWDKFISNLQETNYSGNIVSESHYGEFYSNITSLDFYSQCYKKCEKLHEMLSF